MRIAVVGTGYVGLVTGVVLADLGNEVICVEKDASKLAKLRKGESPIYEPGIEELLQKTLSEGKLELSDNIPDSVRKSEIVIVAVGTPAGADGAPDMGYVDTVAREVAKAIDKYTVVVNKSTVPVGTGDRVEGIIREAGVDDDLFDVVSCPEFLREGSALIDTQRPDRLVVGAKSERATELLLKLFSPFECPVVVTDVRSAELIKYASNSFLATKISFINSISRLCELCGANVADVAKGMGLDERINPKFLGAGLGWGGSCFPKDVLGLISISNGLGYEMSLLRAAKQVNDEQALHLLGRVEKRLGGLEGKTLGLLGLAFKPDTDDIRDAKSLEIIEAALAKGARVRAYDSIAAENVRTLLGDRIELVDSAYEVAEGADALILVTEWKEFRAMDLERLAGKMRTPLLYDGRRLFTRASASTAGFEYHTVGEAS